MITDALGPARSQSYAYDALDRLIQGQGAYGTIGYGYDASRNRLWRTITDSGTVTESYVYDAFSNRLLTVADGVTTRTFGYAADGSVISDDRVSDLFDFTYDAAGRLAEVERNSILEASYANDAFGRRVRKDLGASGTLDYLYDPDGRLLAESDPAPEREYIWLPLDGQAWALPLALVTNAGTAAPSVHYIHTDQLGTPQVMTSSGLASIEWSAAFRPFGEAHAITGSKTLDLRFPGQLFDPETGFHQNFWRDYDPTLGRYLQSDPIGLAGGLNTYGYAYQDPAGLIDPTGENPAVAIRICAGIPACRNAAIALFMATATAIHQALWSKPEFCPVPDPADPFYNEQNDAKAPGQPSAEDGYEPPRTGPRWVKNPNGPGRGWEDKKGDVWVPTGPGSKRGAHGGPHWDVQSRGGKHRNVYPGGRIR